ncbi:MAG TPA: OmpH family outer membrane protein [Pyrinomonadaceae bacterium]|jgi:Skp family chaperone for outer membrane proteins|nr:OmpH family outer membrane protein [Pyrinomonadaceae bacterium]
MKIIRAIAAIAFFAAISAASVAAQPKPTTTPTPTKPGPISSTPATTGSTTGNVPEAKVALVDTDAFLDEKVGIQRLLAAAKKLESEFQPRRTELVNLQSQADKMAADLQKAAPVQDPKVTAQQQDAIEQKKREITRKTEDAQSAYQQRMQALLGPIYDEIGKALDAFAKAHGITLILDVTKVQGIVSADGSLDITKAFVTEFNSKNPATASLTPQP